MEPAGGRLFSIIGRRIMISSITAKDNARYKVWKSLGTRKYREKEGLFLMEGPVLVREALAEGSRFADSLIVRSGAEDEPEVGELMARAEELRAGIYILSGRLFDSLTDTETGRNVIGVFRIPEERPEAVRNGLIVLDRLQDPGNMGTVIRTAEAAGFDGIVTVKGTVDPFSPKVVRSAAGAVLRMPFIPAEDPEDALCICRENGLPVLAGDPLGEDLYALGELPERIALVIGNEGRGVSEALLGKADVRARIPMEGKTESLNAAVAAAIMMYEVVRQRGRMKCRKN